MWGWLWRLLGGGSSSERNPGAGQSPTPTRREASQGSSETAPRKRLRRRRQHVRLSRLRHDAKPVRTPIESVATKPYRFARPWVVRGYLDFSTDTRPDRLARFGLPVFSTPQQLADWLEIPLGRLAWLVHRMSNESRPLTESDSHYHYLWKAKSHGGKRLLEVPKALLRRVQNKILHDILEKVPTHRAAHGFVKKRSIVTNAQPHTGQAVVVKMDLENFYPNVTLSRVVAIFRGLGYSREAAIWLGHLTTTLAPWTWVRRAYKDPEVLPYVHRHLPQGAATSPALANLSAFALDLRLAGMSRKFKANYTRYADDLTFSGDWEFFGKLDLFLPLVTKIIRHERFKVNTKKRQVLRESRRQRVTGVVVNQKTNVSREDYDRLKAILTNCLRHGPASQNRAQHPDFEAHLRGRIAFVCQLNPVRGAKLQELFAKIRWN